MPDRPANRPTAPLHLSVVGHTNTGKTSLMRTLMRDARFGEVAPSSATTRQVEGARLLVDEQTLVELYDTPGLEDAGALIERLDALPGDRHGGPERIRAFLETTDAGQRFEQEARVLRQLLQSDAALYVVDTREPVLGKYQDELAILALCARPVLPVLNFTANAKSRVDRWREALARVGLHAVAEFDTVVFSLEAEARLWRRLATLVESHGQEMERLIDTRERQAEWQHHAAITRVAEMLIDAAAAYRLAHRHDPADIGRATQELQQAVSAREQSCARQLLELFRFDEEFEQQLPLPIDKHGWQHDVFDPALLGLYGKRTGSGLAAGAAMGAAVDVASGGLSLGAGTLVGAISGGGGAAIWQLRRDLADRVRGRLRIMVDAAALSHLAARELALVDALRQRGHAAQTPIGFGHKRKNPWPDQRLPRALIQARLEPALSSLNHDSPHSPGRQERVHALAAQLRKSIRAGIDPHA
ncbi:MAG: DUF3482 domain-containing protein [Wenzhouxiangellaceae bacterium]|nr:DUF3482 domain-containing protein [Wenzhouxiangellaceae bacterium]